LSLFVLASHASGKNITLPDDADPRKFKPKVSHRATNVLWFTSLTLSLLVSILAILAKQWIGMFVTRMRMPVSHLRRWAHRHRAYREGLDRWQLNAFVSGLSVTLHVALLLFLVGLIIYTHTIDLTIFIAVATLSSIGILIYFGTTLAPLADGTCPTATPLLIHGYSFLFWALAWLGWYRDKTEPAFAEDRIVPHPSIGDVGILTWIFENLAGEQDISVAHDAIAVLPRDAPSDRLADKEEIQLSTLDRLEQLVKGRRMPDLEANAAELARAIRSILRTRVSPTETKLVVELADAVKTVRTHDVAVLSRLLCMHATGVEKPVIREPIAEENSDLEDSSVNCYVSQLAGAFWFWVAHENQLPSIPIGDHVCDLLYDFLSRVALPTSFCTSLVLTFCRNQEDGDRWVGLTNLNIKRDLKARSFITHWSPWIDSGYQRNEETTDVEGLDILEFSSESTSGVVAQAMHAWCSHFALLSVFPTSSNRYPCFMAAHCTVLLIERWGRQSVVGVAGMPPSILLAILAPLTTGVADTPGTISGGLFLLMGVIPGEHGIHHHWGAATAQIFCHLLERWQFYHQTPHFAAKTGLEQAFVASLASSFADGHKLLMHRMRSNKSAHDAVRRSTLNLFTPRTLRDSSRTSIWSLLATISRYNNNHSFNDYFDRHVPMISEQLAALGMFDSTLDIGSMFEQLLGDDHGARLLLWTDRTTTDVFKIMRHVASSAPAQWGKLRPALMVDQWPRANGPQRDTPAELAAAAEMASTCADCSALVQQLLEAQDEAAINLIDDVNDEYWLEKIVGCGNKSLQ